MEAGAKAAQFHCGRCHVVPGGDAYGGIGSTPSLALIRGWENWRDLVLSFYTRPPHAAVTQIDGVTPAFDAARPSPIAPMVMTLEDVEAIAGFMETVEPKNVGSID